MNLQFVAQILQLAGQFGPPMISALVSLFSVPAGQAPTVEQWQALINATNTTAKDQMLATLAAHGIDPNSDVGQSFLKLIP